MTTTATKPPPTKPKKEREREKEKERKERASQQPTERLKTIVRRLPPNLPEDVFWQSVQPWVTDETVSWKTYYQGKFRKRLNKENIPSRAYIAFKNEEQLALFSREYDGHLFRDKAGNESQAVVEFAPYQKVPAEKKKPDARNATIEKDEDYISFLESLNAAANAEPVTLEALIAATRPVSPPKTTPLLEALKAEKSALKDKETILRNHAHYKDVTVLRKEEPKKKGGPSVTNQKSTSEPQAPGKKASKKGGPAPPPAAPAHKGQAPASKNGGPAGGPSNPTPKPPKPSKMARQLAKVTPVTITTPSTSAPAANASTKANAIATTLTTTGGEAPAAASAPPRRTRPVIGLASRQFEAALSGVGVAGGGERKTRREKEKEREERREKDVAAVSAGTAVGTSNAATPSAISASDNKSAPPASPRKDRGGRKGGAGASVGAVAGSAANANASGATGKASEPQTIKVPGILQRIDGPPAILQRETLPAPSTNTQGSITTGGTPSVPVAGGGRGGRRGRGRGRGGAA
ncbi:Smg-4/UPF3 family-domain-containing protein, partial [Crucibulum laeve]